MAWKDSVLKFVGAPPRTKEESMKSLGTFLAIAASVAVLGAQEPPASDWPSYNRTLASDRYSPLAQINKSNVSRLKQLCVFDLNVDTNFQTGPIVIGRTL